MFRPFGSSLARVCVCGRHDPRTAPRGRAQGVLHVEGPEGPGQDGLLFPLRGGEEDTRGMV